MLTFLRSLMFVLAKSSQTDQNSSQIQHIPSLLFHWCHFKNSNIFIATLLRERGSFTPQQSDRWLPVSPVLWLVLSHRAVSVSTKPMDTRWLGSCSRCVHRQRDRLSGVLLSEERKSPQSSVQRQSKSQGGLKQFRRTHGNCSWCLQLTAAPPGYSKSPHTPFTTAGPVGVWALQLHGEHAPPKPLAVLSSLLPLCLNVIWLLFQGMGSRRPPGNWGCSRWYREMMSNHPCTHITTLCWLSQSRDGAWECLQVGSWSCRNCYWIAE